MSFFSDLGVLVIKLFDFMGYLILEMIHLPSRLKNIDFSNINIKLNTNSESSETELLIKKAENYDSKNDIIHKKSSVINFDYSSQEKESLILRLQLTSSLFIIVSIAHAFNYIEFYLYLILGFLIVLYILYILFNRLKLVYPHDFNAYRDFFLMYVGVGLILVIISYNPVLTSLFYLQFIPSISLFVYALILVASVFVIFRIFYNRDYTYGLILDSGKNTANVRVDYDIRSNVKPDIYIVENHLDAIEGEVVKLSVEGKLLSTGGNRPSRIIDIL